MAKRKKSGKGTHKHSGRPSVFRAEYVQEMMDYFDIESNELKEITITGKNDYSKTEWKEFASNLPTMQGFCRRIRIDRQTLYNWLKQGNDDGYKGKDRRDKRLLFDTYKKCQEIQEQIWIENSLKGLYNPTFAIFMGKNVFDWKDKTETELSGPGGKDLFPELNPGQLGNIGIEMQRVSATLTINPPAIGN